jgi:GAF domain-containing protein
VIGSQWVGYINAIFADKMQFPEDEIRRLTTLGQQAAVTIQSIRLYAQAESRAEELAILNEMVSELTTMLEVEPILEALYRYSSRLMDTSNFYIAMHNSLTNEVAFPIAVEKGERVSWRSRPYGNGMSEYLLRSGQALFVEDGLEKWLRSQGVESIGSPSQSWMGVPLRIGADVVGVIALQSLQPRFYTREQFDLLNAVANQAVIAIQNARQFQQEQARAQRQQMLREIAAKVRSSADVDTIMRTAVQEIGQALGRQAFVYLGADQGQTVSEDA